MKKLLQDIQTVLDSVACSEVYGVDRAFLDDVENRIRTALASLEPGATPAEVILCQADRMEDEGDERAELARLLMADNWKDAVVDWTMKQPIAYIGGPIFERLGRPD